MNNNKNDECDNKIYINKNDTFSNSNKASNSLDLNLNFQFSRSLFQF